MIWWLHQGPNRQTSYQSLSPWVSWWWHLCATLHSILAMFKFLPFSRIEYSSIVAIQQLPIPGYIILNWAERGWSQRHAPKNTCWNALVSELAKPCGGFLKWWYPQTTPKWWSFLVGVYPWLLGKPTILGNTHVSSRLYLEKKGIACGWKHFFFKSTLPMGTR